MKFLCLGSGWLLVLCAAGCNKSGAVSVSSAAKAQVSVVTARPETRSISWNVEQPGTIHAFEVAPLMVKFPGYVQKVLVDIDDRVEGPQLASDGTILKPGTLLAQLSVPEVVEEIKLKEALVEQALSEIEVARQDLLVAAANVRSAATRLDEMKSGERRAQADFDRWDSESKRVDLLVTKGSMDKATGEETRNQRLAAQSAWEEAKSRIISAEAARQESEAKRKKAEAEIKAAQARHAAAEAEARRVRALKEYTEIRAPFSGVVTGRFVHTGHFLQPTSGSRAEPLFIVARLDPVRVRVEVPELGADRISKGTPATVRVPSLRGHEFKGTVARTAWSLNSESRTLHVEIDIPNADGRIRPGMFASAAIAAETSGCVMIPSSCVFQQDEMNLAYALEGGKVTRYQLRLGRSQGDVVEVIQKRRVLPKAPWQALDSKEEFIARWDGPIEEGSTVQVVPELPKR